MLSLDHFGILLLLIDIHQLLLIDHQDFGTLEITRYRAGKLVLPKFVFSLSRRFIQRFDHCNCIKVISERWLNFCYNASDFMFDYTFIN